MDSYPNNQIRKCKLYPKLSSKPSSDTYIKLSIFLKVHDLSSIYKSCSLIIYIKKKWGFSHSYKSI